MPPPSSEEVVSCRFISLPAAHTCDNCHTFNWTKTQLHVLGRAQTKYAREFKEAWYSTDYDTLNRHFDKIDYDTINRH